MRDKGGKRSKNVGGGLRRPPPPPVSSPVIHKSRSRSSGHRKSETVRAVAKQGRSQEPPSDNHYPQNDMYGHASNVVDERRLSHHSARKEDPPDEFPKTQRSRSKTKRKDDTHDHNNINSNSEVRRSNVDHSQESREPSARASLQDVMRKSTKKRGDSTSNGFSNDSTARISNSKNDRSGIKKNKQTRQPPTSSSKPKFHENTGLSFLNSDTDNDYPLLDLEEQQYEQYQEQLYNQQYLQQPQLQQCDPSTSTQHRQFNLSPLYDLEMTSMGNINKKSSKKDSSNQHKNQKQKKIDQHHQSSHARKSSQGSKKQSIFNMISKKSKPQHISNDDDDEHDESESDENESSIDDGFNNEYSGRCVTKSHEEFYNLKRTQYNGRNSRNDYHDGDDDDYDEDMEMVPINCNNDDDSEYSVSDDEEDEDDDEERPLRKTKSSTKSKASLHNRPMQLLTRSEKIINRTLLVAFAAICFIFVRDRTPWWKEHKRRAYLQQKSNRNPNLDPMAVYNSNDDDSTHTKDHDPLNKYDQFTAGERISSRPAHKSLNHGFMDETYENRPAAENSLSTAAVRNSGAGVGSKEQDEETAAFLKSVIRTPGKTGGNDSSSSSSSKEKSWEEEQRNSQVISAPPPPPEPSAPETSESQARISESQHSNYNSNVNLNSVASQGDATATEMGANGGSDSGGIMSNSVQSSSSFGGNNVGYNSASTGNDGMATSENTNGGSLNSASGSIQASSFSYSSSSGGSINLGDPVSPGSEGTGTSANINGGSINNDNASAIMQPNTFLPPSLDNSSTTNAVDTPVGDGANEAMPVATNLNAGTTNNDISVDSMQPSTSYASSTFNSGSANDFDNNSVGDLASVGIEGTSMQVSGDSSSKGLSDVSTSVSSGGDVITGEERLPSTTFTSDFFDDSLPVDWDGSESEKDQLPQLQELQYQQASSSLSNAGANSDGGVNPSSLESSDILPPDGSTYSSTSQVIESSNPGIGTDKSANAQNLSVNLNEHSGIPINQPIASQQSLQSPSLNHPMASQAMSGEASLSNSMSVQSADQVKAVYQDTFYRWNHVFRPKPTSDDPGRDVPVFWRIPRSASSTMESIMTYCYGMTLASALGTTSGHDQDETLGIMTVGAGGQYVNVNMSNPPGVQRAKSMNLGSSGMADVISTPFLYETADIFRGIPESAKCFTLLRHPVDRAVALYHLYQMDDNGNPSTAQYRGMTIDQYAESAAENNWMVRFLTSKRAGTLTWHDLEAAKEVFGRKCLVGLVDKTDESIRRYERFFGWDTKVSNADLKNECVQKYQLNGDKRNNHHTYEGTNAWEVLRKKNEYDVLLYEYAKNLYTQQSTIYEKML